MPEFRPATLGVEIRGLVKRFRDHRAVDGVDLSVRNGEFLVLLGPSGCGKTTLLRMVAGLERPTAGEIAIGGVHMRPDTPPRARKVAMVFQSHALYPHRTVYRNISFPLEAAHMPRRLIEEKVRSAARLFHIERLIDRYPGQLSGGERQRVALCRALVRDPRVFLFDEPLASLDAKLRNSARDELKVFQRRVGITSLYVTHDQIEAMGLGDRIAVMDGGRVRQVGTPAEVYRDPADTFVATFVGQPPMNLIEVDEPGLPARTLVGFRPEDFLPLGAVARREETRTFPFHIRRVEFLGADRYAYGSIPGCRFPDTTVISRLPGTLGASVPEGETREFAVPRSSLRYFDADSGVRRSP